VSDPLDLTGRVVVVTGGGRGVGRGISDAFLGAGAEVVIVSRSEPATLPAAAGRTASYVAADVRDVEAARSAIDTVGARHGRIDVLVNNAGGAPPSEAATASPRFFEKVIALNLVAPFVVAQAANVVMQRQDDGGVIVNIGSVSGQRPSPSAAAYGAAKAGLANLTRTLAVEWAPKVRVNLVVGGLIRTEQSELFYGDDSGVLAVGATVPLGRMAEPADIGSACLYLSSPLAAYVSGAELLVHGGGERPAFLAAAQPVVQPRPGENSP
jgi:NAD(P)-dependent dehydrogenase (short-subunit alcohol dehydrogenase family)